MKQTAFAKLTIAALALGLAGCANLQRNTAANAPAPAANASTAGTQAKKAPVIITLHLAQPQADASLMKIDANGTALYAVPKPVLTQDDMVRASPLETDDHRSFLMIEMNPAGAKKLQYITEKGKGYFLLLTVQGSLVSAAQIAGPITNGKLLISTKSPQETAAILRMIQG